MLPIEVLMYEHRVIEQVLDCLETMARGVESGNALDAGQARDAIDFFRNYADRCHHGKEEDLLFPALLQSGMQD